MSHLLQIRNLSVSFDGPDGVVPAVNSVSFDMAPGETLAILGESGSGKSVTASAIMDIIDRPPGRIESGQILYRGKDLLKVSTAERRAINGRRISMIFQDPLAALNPVYPIGWQIAETMRAHKISSGNIGQRVIDLLARVGISDPERRARDYPHQFSGGQRQRIMIASAICLEPDLLVADEPTSALDVTVQAQVLTLLKSIQAETQMGLLMITHDLTVAGRIADRIVVMKGGEVVEQGDTRTVLTQPKHPYTQKLIAASLAGTGSAPAVPTQRDQTPLLSVRNVSKTYQLPGRAIAAVSELSFDMAKGETLGVVGESGSGKSTLGRMLLGLENPSEGSIHFDGQDMSALSRRDNFTIRRRMQFVFQDPTASLNPHMTIHEIISEPWAIHPDVLDKGRWPARVGELLERVGLSASHANRFPSEFSGGQRQRIAIARSLALSPDLIVCDEAVSALDASVRAQIMDLLEELRKDLGVSYVFIAHDLELVRSFATRTLVMLKGRIVEQGDTQAIFDNPQQQYTKDLINASGMHINA